MDLKQTYEALLETPDEQSSSKKRTMMVKKLLHAMGPLQQFDDSMQAERDELGTTARLLLDRCIELRESLPDLDALTFSTSF